MCVTVFVFRNLAFLLRGTTTDWTLRFYFFKHTTFCLHITTFFIHNYIYYNFLIIYYNLFVTLLLCFIFLIENWKSAFTIGSRLGKWLQLGLIHTFAFIPDLGLLKNYGLLGLCLRQFIIKSILSGNVANLFQIKQIKVKIVSLSL